MVSSFREIVLDELQITTTKDCTPDNTACSTKQTFNLKEIHVPEELGEEIPFLNDIALIRLDRPAKLAMVSRWQITL